MKKLALLAAVLLGATAASQAGIDIHIGLPLPPLPRVIIGHPAPVIVAPAPRPCPPPVVVVAPPRYCPPPVVVYGGYHGYPHHPGWSHGPRGHHHWDYSHGQHGPGRGHGRR